MQCLDDDTLVAFIEQSMPPALAAAVEDHIAACAACRRLVAVAVGELAPTVLGDTAPTASQGSRIPRGALIGRYEVLDVLGAGGMGVVYAANDPHLDRKVAIKVLHAGLSTPEHVARLQREARALARLAHPNVVTVYDVGTHDNTVFVTMELVTSGTLGDWLRREPRTWSEVLAIFLQAAMGLAAAHAAGLVHRDFKPANVLVGTDGRVRVTDFGLARSSEIDSNVMMARRSRPALAGVTTTGAHVGTPSYMPPEQFDGLPADERSDQFSFAVSLFEGLYGERPFAGDTPDEIVANIRSAAIRSAPPTSKVPTWLRTAILPALAAQPEARYPTFAAFIERLRRDRGKRRRRIAIVVAPLVVIGAIVAGYDRTAPTAPPCEGSAKLDRVWNDGRRQAVGAAFRATGKSYAETAWAAVRRDIDRYAHAWTAMRIEACEATRSGEQSEDLLDRRMQCLDTRLRELDALASALSRVDGTSVARSDRAVGGLPPIVDCANVAWLRSRVRLPDTPIVRSRVDAVERELARAQSLFATGRYAEGLTVVRAAVEAARTINYPPLTAAAELRFGILQERSAEAGAAAGSFKRAILAAEAGGDDELAVRAWTQVLVHETNRGNYAPAMEAGEHARALLHKLHGADALENRLAFASAALLQQQGQYTEAEKLARRAIELSRKIGTVHGLVNTLDLLSKILSDAGRNDEALKLGQQALHTAENAFGRDHPEIAFILDGLAQVQLSLDQPEDARATTERALALREASLPPGHAAIAASLANLATMAVELGRYKEGLAYDHRALAIYKSKLGPDHPSVARALENMSKAELALGHVDAAVRYAQESLRIREKAHGPEHDDVATSLLFLGRALVAKRRLPAALAAIQRAVAIDERVLGPQHPMLVELHTELAIVLIRSGRSAAAIPAADRALQIGGAAHVPTVRLARARFVRARARWQTGDRAGALADAQTARAALATAADNHDDLVEIDAWLAAHAKRARSIR